MSKKRTFTTEFKIEAVRLLTEEGYTTRQASESLGVSQNTLRTWRKRLENEADTEHAGKGKISSRDEQLQRLQVENRRLRMERDILKKRRPSSRTTRTEIRLDRKTSQHLAHCRYV